MAGLFAGTPLEQPVTCEVCNRTLAECTCPRSASGRVVLPGDQLVRIRREKRRGKFVTVIAGLDPVANDLKKMAGALRKQIGAGGTVARDEIELQGDHRDAMVEQFKKLGYPAKPSGG